MLPTAYCLLVVVLLRQPFELLEEHQRAVRRDLEPLAARLARDVVVHANQVILRLLEQRAVARVGPAGKLRLLGAPHPADAVLVGPPAPRTLERVLALFRFLREKLTFVH